MHNKCKIVDSLKNLLFFVVLVAVTVAVAESSWCHDNDGNGAQWLIMAALKYQRHIYSKRALHFLAHFLASTHSDNAKFRPNFKSYGGKPVLKKKWLDDRLFHVHPYTFTGKKRIPRDHTNWNNPEGVKTDWQGNHLLYYNCCFLHRQTHKYIARKPYWIHAIALSHCRTSRFCCTLLLIMSLETLRKNYLTSFW